MKCRQGSISNSSSSSFIITTNAFEWNPNKRFQNRDPKTGRFIKIEKEDTEQSFDERLFKMNKKKIEVTEEVIVNIEGSYEEFLENLNEKFQILKSKGINIIEVEYNFNESISLSGKRLETDKEFNSRISKVAENIENRKNTLKSALINFSKDCPKEYKELMEEL